MPIPQELPTTQLAVTDSEPSANELGSWNQLSLDQAFGERLLSLKSSLTSNQVSREHLSESFREEWQYRHGFYWKSFYFWWFGVVFVQAVPWLEPLVGARVAETPWLFPIVGVLMSSFACWHLLAEERRVVEVSIGLKMARGTFKESRPVDPKDWIGRRLTIGSAAALIGLSILNFILLR